MNRFTGIPVILRFALKRPVWVLLATFLILLQVSTPLVNAQAVTSIPSGLSQTDQDAINGGWINEVTSSCTSSVSDLTPGTGSSTGAAFPNLDPTSMSNAINTWITQQNPNSELSGLGTTIVADGQHSNVSPFLIVAIANKESSLASPSDYNVMHGNNSFGRSAGPGQPSFQGSRAWYYWSSVKASVDYTAPENQNIPGGGDMATYLRDQFGSDIDSNDLLGFMEAYAPPSENNTNQYITEVQSWVSQLVSLTTGTASAGVGASSVTSSTPSAGNCGCPSSSSSTASATSVDMADAQSLAQAAGIQVGISASDTSGNILANYNGDTPVYGASITKVMILIAYLRQAGSQPPTGNENTLLTNMIEQSDDASANTVFSQVGAAAVQQVATDAGMTHFTLDTSDPLYTLGQSQVTANDQARLFAKLNSLIPASQLSYAQNLMSNISTADQWGILSANIPANLYSKAGWKTEPPSGEWIINQGAQVVPNDSSQPTIGVAVVTFGSTTMAQGEQLLQSIFTKLLSPLTVAGSPGSCTGGTGNIAQTAINLAWPSPFTTATTARSSPITPTPAYAAALQQFNPSEFSATGGTGDDCGVFVATVMRASGADPNYPVVSTVTQANYVISHPNLYTVTYPATSTSQLQPGDILILNTGTYVDANGTIHVGSGGGGAGGHTFIYVGPQAGGYNEASASLGTRSANLGVAALTDTRGQFLIARLKAQ